MLEEFSFQSNTFSKYEYIPKGTQSSVISDIPEIINNINGNILDFSTKFKSGEVNRPILEKIARELESTARYFGAQQGLSESRLLNKENLYAEVKNGNTIYFINRATDDYNRYYAGHIEYGHYSKNKKKFIPARPFMRPALFAVSKNSTNELGDVLGALLQSAFTKNGYQGLDNLRFGLALGDAYHYSNASYDTVRGLLSGKIFESDEGYYSQDAKYFGKYTGAKRPNFVMTGRDLNTMPGFEKKMGTWSLKRYSGSSFQKNARKTHGFDAYRRNPLKRAQNFHSLTSERKISQARAHANYNPQATRSYKERPLSKKNISAYEKYRKSLKTPDNYGHKTQGEYIRDSIIKDGYAGAKDFKGKIKGKGKSINQMAIEKASANQGKVNTIKKAQKRQEVSFKVYKNSFDSQKRVSLGDEGIKDLQKYGHVWSHGLKYEKHKDGLIITDSSYKTNKRVNKIKNQDKLIGAREVKDLPGYYNIDVYYPSGTTSQVSIPKDRLEKDFYYDKKVSAYKEKGLDYK